MQFVVTCFATLRKEVRDLKRPIIDIADCEIDGKHDWVRAGMISRVRADQWNFWKALACTRGIGLYGRSRNSRLLRGTRNIRSDHLVNLFRLIANERQRLTSSRFPLSVIGLMSTRNLNEKNLGLQSINQSYEPGVEFYIVNPSFVQENYFCRRINKLD